MSVHDMTEQEFSEYEKITGKAEWMCEHDKLYTEECDECDLYWAEKEHAEAVTEGVIVDDTEPDDCDHGKPMLAPRYGACDECDKVCGNTKTMAQNSCWRFARGKKWRYSALEDMWVENTYGDSGWQKGSTGYTSTKKATCSHFMQDFELEEGLSIFASAYRDVPYHEKRKTEDYPDLGIYLYSGWVSGSFASTPGLDVPWSSKAMWPMAWLDWPDYGVPDWDKVVVAVPWVMEHIKQAKIVETGCMGGHGRTGTLLALLLVQQGVKPGTAMARVWDKYCIEAIESIKQVELVIEYYEHLHGKKWKQSKPERKLVQAARDVFKPKDYNKTKTNKTTQKGVTNLAPKGSETKCIHMVPINQPCTGCEYSGWC